MKHVVFLSSRVHPGESPASFVMHGLLLFLSSALLGELGGWSANQYLGCFLTFLAAGFYSYSKAAASKPPPAPVVAPSEKESLMKSSS